MPKFKQEALTSPLSQEPGKSERQSCPAHISWVCWRASPARHCCCLRNPALFLHALLLTSCWWSISVPLPAPTRCCRARRGATPAGQGEHRGRRGRSKQRAPTAASSWKTPGPFWLSTNPCSPQPHQMPGLRVSPTAQLRQPLTQRRSG